MTYEHLNIKERGSLEIKTNYQSIVDTTKDIGSDELYYQFSERSYQVTTTSSECMRETLYNISCCIYQNEAAARMWINAFFFRAAAMLLPDKKMASRKLSWLLLSNTLASHVSVDVFLRRRSS